MLIKLMNIIMLTCKEATALIAVRHFRKLSFREKVQLKLHLFGCHACRKFSRQTEYINHAVDKLNQRAEQISAAEYPEHKKLEVQKHIAENM